MFEAWYQPNWDVKQLNDLTGKIAIVTGGNTGIGKETCYGLVRKGVKVYLAARSETKAEKAIQDIKRYMPNADIQYHNLDLNDLDNVRTSAESFKRKEKKLNFLFNNAGVMVPPYQETKQGYESQFGVNHVGHFLFTDLLLPVLEKTAETEDVRIIQVSSEGHRFAPSGGINFENVNMKEFNAWRRYGQSKLANILFAKELKRRYPKIKSYAIHPGGVKTELGRGIEETYPFFLIWAFKIMSVLFFLTPAQGAMTSLHCLDPSVDEKSGTYWVPYGKEAKPAAYALDESLAKKLYDWTTEQLKGKGFL